MTVNKTAVLGRQLGGETRVTGEGYERGCVCFKMGELFNTLKLSNKGSIGEKRRK